MELNERRISDTQSLWSAKFGQEIGDEDARVINESLLTYFRLLKIWKNRQIKHETSPGIQ